MRTPAPPAPNEAINIDFGIEARPRIIRVSLRCDLTTTDIGVKRLRFDAELQQGRFSFQPRHMLIILIKIDDVQCEDDIPGK